MQADDPFRNTQQALNKDLMDAFMRLPVSLERLVQGEEGAYEIPPEQAAEALQANLLAVLRHLPNIAGGVDMANGRLDALEARVRALEEQER